MERPKGNSYLGDSRMFYVIHLEQYVNLLEEVLVKAKRLHEETIKDSSIKECFNYYAIDSAAYKLGKALEALEDAEEDWT